MKLLIYLLCCGVACAAMSDNGQRGRHRPTYEEARAAAIADAQKELETCQKQVADMQAWVDIMFPGEEPRSYAVKPGDMPRLRYIVSRLKVNPAYAPRKASMKLHPRRMDLRLAFGKYGTLYLRGRLTTYPGDSGSAPIRCLYWLPSAELSKELIAIFFRALPPQELGK